MEKDEQAKKDLVAIDGIVDSIIYHNEENGYTIFEIATADKEHPQQEIPVTVVGTIPSISEGTCIKVMGSWVIHPSYGRQFRMEYYEQSMPVTSDAILRYLSSGAIKGIGPKTAAMIVGQYGADTFDVIENHPEWLADLPGISQKKAEAISEHYRAQFGMRNVMLFCQDFCGPATSIQIYKKWGGSAIDIIKQNPYRLCDEIHGIGFARADGIAQTLGIENYKEERICAGIKHILTENASQNGHVYLPAEKLVEAAMALLSVTEEEVEQALARLSAEEAIVIPPTKHRRVYLKRYYNAERYIVDKLVLLSKLGSGTHQLAGVEAQIDFLEDAEGLTYAKAQRQAISGAIKHGVMLLTGGPGTGKTTVIRAVIRLFEDMGYDVALAAPTGRAAKRMSDATACEARTIHRLLEMEYSAGEIPRFKRCETDLLDESVIIIDEMSMVDTLLMEALLRAIKPGAHLVLIGDADQLPSVGAGNVLCDLLASDCFHTVRLTEIFRQAQESLIITNAHAINAGEYPELFEKHNDFFFLARENDGQIAATIADLCVHRLPKSYGREIRDKIQVIAPSRKGEAGTIALNVALQSVLNPPAPIKREKKVGERIFRVGDKVMQTRNNYDLLWEKDGVEGCGIFNGDIGIVQSIDYATESMTILFDDRTTPYAFENLDDLEHAYAITVHKSQGSEYPVVILPMYNFTNRLLTRSLLYTAVTRAQKMVILVGRPEVVKGMVDNDRRVNRYTGLRRLLRKACKSTED